MGISVNYKSFEADVKYIIGIRKKPTRNQPLATGQIEFTGDPTAVFGKFLIDKKAANTYDFFNKNPLGLPAKLYTICTVDANGNRTYFDEGTPLAGGTGLADVPTPQTRSKIDAAQQQVQTQQNQFVANLIASIQQELAAKNIQIEQLTNRIHELHSEVILAKAGQVRAEEAYQRIQDQVTFREAEVKRITDEMEKEYDADVRLEAKKMKERDGNGLSDGISSLLANPLAQQIGMAIVAKIVGVADTQPQTLPQPTEGA